MKAVIAKKKPTINRMRSVRSSTLIVKIIWITNIAIPIPTISNHNKTEITMEVNKNVVVSELFNVVAALNPINIIANKNNKLAKPDKINHAIDNFCLFVKFIFLLNFSYLTLLYKKQLKHDMLLMNLLVLLRVINGFNV
ncbi:hypothetical protein EG856_00720 [Mycoplasmopsis phocirhinis]|uniref:Uncharacterized protein n=1 Tax=Mycoplasmopsis phocirhinis TaxID=142650 RepID=A0A4P6MS24_9BACT|nr:hypothetical protein [Mycoplasmopsis phocirhinis]QBF34454.1 hypothetical protein EG856_00720 [Mycoplasmopsis phocirhinis]